MLMGRISIVIIQILLHCPMISVLSINELFIFVILIDKAYASFHSGLMQYFH